ncbi:unnamed protein product [Amoebophrya sp. A25]|nr:unnamed protein product [Amoebophrya sp. A25]|eukprot:GSA25T00004649001.1
MLALHEPAMSVSLVGRPEPPNTLLSKNRSMCMAKKSVSSVLVAEVSDIIFSGKEPNLKSGAIDIEVGCALIPVCSCYNIMINAEDIEEGDEGEPMPHMKMKALCGNACSRLFYG